MNAIELGQLLAEVSVIDRRPVDEAAILAWMPLVGDLPFPVAAEAVRLHRRESTAWLTPAHVRDNVTRILHADPHPTDEFGNHLDVDTPALAARARLEEQKAVTS